MKRPKLIRGWKRILRRAWSIRINLVAALFSAAEIVLPFIGSFFPEGLFAALAGVTFVGGTVARLLPQGSLEPCFWRHRSLPVFAVGAEPPGDDPNDWYEISKSHYASLLRRVV